MRVGDARARARTTEWRWPRVWWKERPRRKRGTRGREKRRRRERWDFSSGALVADCPLLRAVLTPLSSSSSSPLFLSFIASTIPPTPPSPFPSHLLRRTPLIQSFSCAPLEDHTSQRSYLRTTSFGILGGTITCPRNSQATIGSVRSSKEIAKRGRQSLEEIAKRRRLFCFWISN